MTLLHSGYTPKINLSAEDMLEISQEISRDFAPSFSSQTPKPVDKTPFISNKAPEISEDIGRGFRPCFLTQTSKRAENIKFTPNELREIGEDISRGFTPRFSSQTPKLVEKVKFTAKELADISEEIGRDYAPQKSYQSPELMLLPVDPGHLHAYWNLDRKPKIATPYNDDPHKLTLRIYAQSEKKKALADTATWFDVAIDSSATHRQVSLPGPTGNSVYSAAIGQYGADDDFIVFAQSNTIHTPGGHHYAENFTYCPSKTASGQGIGKPA